MSNRAGRAYRRGISPATIGWNQQLLFYNTLLDYSDLVADFEAWELEPG